MHQQTDGNDELMRLARTVGIYIGVFLAGGLITFVYSYSPLHKAKAWKIDYLEDRLETKDGELQAVQQELASFKAENHDKPDGETFKMLQDELVTVDKTVKELERKLAKSDRRVKELEKSRDSWKTKAAEAESKRDALAARSATPTSEESSGPPASPAPAAPSNSGEKVTVGQSWQRADGRAGFALAGIDGNVARVVPDPGQASEGSEPQTIQVGVGDRFEIGAATGTTTRIAVRRIDKDGAIWIETSR